MMFSFFFCVIFSPTVARTGPGRTNFYFANISTLLLPQARARARCKLFNPIFSPSGERVGAFPLLKVTHGRIISIIAVVEVSVPFSFVIIRCIKITITVVLQEKRDVRFLFLVCLLESNKFKFPFNVPYFVRGGLWMRFSAEMSFVNRRLSASVSHGRGRGRRDCSSIQKTSKFFNNLAFIATKARVCVPACADGCANGTGPNDGEKFWFHSSVCVCMCVCVCVV